MRTARWLIAVRRTTTTTTTSRPNCWTAERLMMTMMPLSSRFVPPFRLSSSSSHSSRPSSSLSRSRTRLVPSLLVAHHQVGADGVSPFFSLSSSSYSSDSTSSSSSSSSSNSKNSETTLLEQNLQRARALLYNIPAPPQGNWTASQCAEVKYIFDFIHRVKPIDAESVNVIIALMERTVAERATTSSVTISDSDHQHHHCKFICDERYFNPLLNLWKEAAKIVTKTHQQQQQQQQQAATAAATVVAVVPSPRELWQKLDTLTRLLPHGEFQYSIITVNLILEVMVKKEPLLTAPLVAEDQLNKLLLLQTPGDSLLLRPDVWTYNIVLQAWAVSGLRHAPDKMEELVYTVMRQHNVTPSDVTYTILLRYWATRGVVSKMEEILERVQQQQQQEGGGLAPSRSILLPAIYGFANEGRHEKAEELLMQLEQIRPKDEAEATMISRGVQNILYAYRKILDTNDDANKTDPVQKEKAVERAEALFHRMRSSSMLNDAEKSRLHGTMMDIYAFAGKHDRVETMSKRPQLDRVQLNISIKSLGRADKADEATAVLIDVLRKESRVVDPDIVSFNTLINAWAESSKSDATNQAFEIFRLVKEDPKCKQLGIRPDTVTFNSLLKCLTKIRNAEKAKQAIGLLDEMEQRYRDGEKSAKPNESSFKLAIRVCLQAGKGEEAEALATRMEKSGIPPDIRTFSSILSHWSKVGTAEAASHAENILQHMKQLAKTKTPLVKPNEFSYDIVLNAWAKSGHDEAGERMWLLFEQMKADRVKLNSVTFTTMITYFAKSKEQEMLKRADSLLQFMEKSKRADFQPDNRQYIPVLQGWMRMDDVENAARVLLRFIYAPTPTKPSPQIVDWVLQGLLKIGDVEGATTLIAKIHQTNDADLLPRGPSSDTYNSLLLSWKNSNHPTEKQA